MRSGSFADSLLALFTSPDRASSIIGDLAEQTHAHGRTWFSLQVVRTTVALFWQDLAEAPLRISALVIAGIIPHSVMAALIALPLGQVVGWLPNYGPLTGWTPWQVALLVCGQVLFPLMVGFLLARFSKGHPMTVCISSAVVGQGLLTALRCHSAWTLMEELTLADKLFYLFNLDPQAPRFHQYSYRHPHVRRRLSLPTRHPAA